MEKIGPRSIFWCLISFFCLSRVEGTNANAHAGKTADSTLYEVRQHIENNRDSFDIGKIVFSYNKIPEGLYESKVPEEKNGAMLLHNFTFPKTAMTAAVRNEICSGKKHFVEIASGKVSDPMHFSCKSEREGIVVSFFYNPDVIRVACYFGSDGLVQFRIFEADILKKFDFKATRIALLQEFWLKPMMLMLA